MLIHFYNHNALINPYNSLLITITKLTILANILYITFIPKVIEGYKRNDSLKRIVTGYT